MSSKTKVFLFFFKNVVLFLLLNHNSLISFRAGVDLNTRLLYITKAHCQCVKEEWSQILSDYSGKIPTFQEYHSIFWRIAKRFAKELLGDTDIILNRSIEKYYVTCLRISKYWSHYLPCVLEKCTHVLGIQDLKEKKSFFFCIKISSGNIYTLSFLLWVFVLMHLRHK